MKKAHPHPADIAMNACDKVSVCMCRLKGFFDRNTCESKYWEAVDKIIERETGLDRESRKKIT